MYIPCVPVVIENINEDSPFLLTTSIIERWRVRSDSYSIRTRIIRFGVFVSFFSGFALWVSIYFAINNSYIIGIFFKVSSHYLFFYNAIFAMDLSFLLFVVFLMRSSCVFNIF